MEYVLSKDYPAPRVVNSFRLLTWSAFCAFFFFGFTDNLKGAVLPSLLADLHLSYAEGGALFPGGSLGFCFTTLIAGSLSDRFGKQIVMLLGGTCLFVGTAGFSFAPSFSGLALAVIIGGLGGGFIEVGASRTILDGYAAEKGRYLNLLAFFYGVGSMFAPFIAGQLLSMGYPWQRSYHFILIGIGGWLGLLLLLFWKTPATHVTHHARIDWPRFRQAAFSRQMLGYYLVITLYVALEIGIAIWLVEFLQKVKAVSVFMSSLALSVFFGLITAGRFVGSRIVERVGYLNLLCLSATAAAVCVATGTFGPVWLAWSLPLSGLFLAIIYPTVTALVSNLHHAYTGTILGILFMFAGLGGMTGPWAVGLLSNSLGIQCGFGVTTMFGIALIATLGGLFRAQQIGE